MDHICCRPLSVELIPMGILRKPTLPYIDTISEECITTRNGTEYLGKTDITNDGKTCNKWSDTWVDEAYHAMIIPDGSWESAMNYCRVVFGILHPGCFYDGVWMLCSIPYCCKQMMVFCISVSCEEM